MSNVALNIGTSLHKLQTGSIYHYTLTILIGITVLLGLRELFVLFGYFFDYRLLLIVLVLIFF